MCTLGAVKLGSWILLKTRDPVPTMKFEDGVKIVDGKILVKNEDGTYCGINEHGIAIICSVVRLNGEVSQEFIGNWMPELLGEKDIDEIIKKIKATKKQMAGNLIIADTVNCYGVEYCLGNVEVHKFDGCGALTNHYLKIKEGYQRKEEYPTSFFRLDRVNELLLNVKDLGDVKNILKDHGHVNRPGDNSICRHPDDKNNRFTQSAFILDPMNKTLYYCEGNPCENEFKEYSLE